MVASVSSALITVTATISPAGYSMGNEAFIEGGGMLTGDNSANQLPNNDIIRIPAPVSGNDLQFITVRNTA